jgi:hypothetical protein
VSRQPFRFQMDFTVAAADMDHAVTLHDRLVALAESVGLEYEGGCVCLMPSDQVIPESPLARALVS